MSVNILEHPVAQDALLRLRDKHLSDRDFRREIQRVGSVLAIAATEHLELIDVPVVTPLAPTTGKGIRYRHTLTPITRAGNGFLDAFLPFLPEALVWHVNVARDEETHMPIFHGSKIPTRVPDEDYTHFVLDLMLATCGSAILAIQQLKKAGAQRIVFVGLIAAQESVERMQREHPDVEIILVAVDPILNEKKYIVPGLGDAGDRQYPTV